MDFQSIAASIKTLSEDERPREKIWLKGIHSLSDSELLAIIISSGNRDKNALDLSREILKVYDHSLISLSKAHFSEYLKFKGIGKAKASSIAASLELARRSLKERSSAITKIQSSQDAFDLIKPYLFRLRNEEFWVCYLDRANQVLSIQNLSKGGIHGTVVDIRLLFKSALDHLASSLILFHNHPSGNLRPSTNDDQLTKQILDAGKLLDILILDHLIVNDENFYSYADNAKLLS